MSEPEYCTCDVSLPIRGRCGYCTQWIRPPDTVPVDRALLLRLARLVSEMRLVDLMTDGYTIDDAKALRMACAQMRKEYGECP